MNVQNLIELILNQSETLVNLIAEDRAIKPSGPNRYIDIKDKSFSLYRKGEQWSYNDFAKDDKGNLITYLKNYRGCKDLIDCANFLGIDTSNVKKPSHSGAGKVSQPRIDWALQERQEVADTVQWHGDKFGQLEIDFTTVREVEQTSDKNVWTYDIPLATKETTKHQKGRSPIKGKIEIIAEKYRGNDGVKRWQFKRNEYRLFGDSYALVNKGFNGYFKTLNDSELLKGFDGDLSLSDLHFYRFNEIQNINYLIDCEGETDADKAISLGLNATSCGQWGREHQRKAVKKLIAKYPDIKFVVIFADNDSTGISKGKEKIKAYKEAGLVAIALNSFTRKLITKFEPEFDLPNYLKGNDGKFTNDRKGYDFRDLITDLESESLNVIDSLKGIINIATNELLSFVKRDVTAKEATPEKKPKKVIMTKSIDEKYQRDLANFYSFNADREIKHNYLSANALLDAVNDDLSDKVIAIKSGLGSNKTGSVLDFLNHPDLDVLLDADCLKDNGVLWLSDINKLLIQTTSRGNNLISIRKRSYYHLRTDLSDAYADNFIADTSSNLSLCIQSLPRFKKEDFDGRIVVIDESMSVIHSLMSGEAMRGKDDQQFISQKLRECLIRSKLVIILDGNLSDSNANLFAILGRKELFKIENIAINKKPYTIYNLKDWNSAKLQAYSDLKMGKKVCILSDSQAELEKIKLYILNAHILEESNIVYMHQGSTSQEAPSEFLANPDKYLENNDIRLLMGSPSMGRGFDIQTDIFDYQYCYFCGVLLADQCDQMIFRLRSLKTKRYVYCSDRLLNTEKLAFTINTAANNYIEICELIDNKASELDIARLAKLSRENELFKYSERLDDFIQLTKDSHNLYLMAFLKLKGHQVLNCDNKDSKASELKDFERELMDKKEEEKQAIIAAKIENILSIKSNQNEIENIEIEITETQEKLDNPMLMSVERINQLNQIVGELSEKKEYIKNELKQAESFKSSLAKRLPNLDNSAALNDKNILSFLADKDLVKSYKQKLLRLACLRENELPSSNLKNLIYLFIRSERLYGTTWVNGLDNTPILINELKKMGLIDFLTENLNNSKFTKEHPFIAGLASQWNESLFGELPKREISQVSKLLDLIGFSCVSKGVKKGIKQYSLDYSIRAIYPALSMEKSEVFYGDICQGILKEIKEKKQRERNWENLPKSTEALPDKESIVLHQEKLTKNNETISDRLLTNYGNRLPKKNQHNDNFTAKESYIPLNNSLIAGEVNTEDLPIKGGWGLPINFSLPDLG